MIISLVVAVAENGVIGRDGTLPWRISSDLKTFRRLTMGKPLIMGRRTFQSLKKPLDGRDNIVVTRRRRLSAPTAPSSPTTSIAALDSARECAIQRGVNEIAVIGGTAVFEAALPLAHRIYKTEVHASPTGDAFFPQVDWDEWHGGIARGAAARAPRTTVTCDAHRARAPPRLNIAGARPPRLNASQQAPNLMQRVCAAGTPCPISDHPTFTPRIRDAIPTAGRCFRRTWRHPLKH